MSWTIAGTTVPNPIFGGFVVDDEPVGGAFDALDGSLTVHKVTSRVVYNCHWVVPDTDFNNLITALRGLVLSTGTVVDHLGASYTMTITDPIRHAHAGTSLREVEATLRETTA